MKINRETLEYLAELGRIKIEEKEEAKLLRDLEKILAYFDELKEVNTEGVEPLAGGTCESNVLRNDEPRPLNPPKREKLISQFRDEEGEFLRIPAVFEE